jgi:hypothetical protein
MRGGKQMIKLKISQEHLIESLSLLKEFADKERVIFWLGKKDTDAYLVEEVFVPVQITEKDQFIIPPEGMTELLTKLKSTRTMLVAQIHTHPFEAFHSPADDRWAILRHLNAYSIVLPWFGSTTTLNTFHDNAATFVLTHLNKWVEVGNNNIIVV